MVCALGAASCSSSEERPAPLGIHGRAVENPRSCRDIQAGSAQGDRVFLNELPAHCAVNRLACPLGKDFPGAAPCANAQLLYATCTNNDWTLGCVPAPTPADASSDSSALDLDGSEHDAAPESRFDAAFSD